MLGASDEFHLSPGYQPLMRLLGLDARGIFEHPSIRVWRSISERENATLDGEREDGSPVRLHIKRYHATGKRVTPAEQEAAGIRLLQEAKIPTVPLVGYGKLTDGRSFLVSEELEGFRPADRAAREGMGLEGMLDAVADLAGRLHGAGLHHRDLYLCHVFVNARMEVRLIDAGRVKRLPGWPRARRWVVKDLAQLWHSLAEAGASDAMQRRWLGRYAERRGIARGGERLRRSVEAKAKRIARHDANLRRKQPGRNISISGARGSGEA